MWAKSFICRFLHSAKIRLLLQRFTPWPPKFSGDFNCLRVGSRGRSGISISRWAFSVLLLPVLHCLSRSLVVLRRRELDVKFSVRFPGSEKSCLVHVFCSVAAMTAGSRRGNLAPQPGMNTVPFSLSACDTLKEFDGTALINFGAEKISSVGFGG